MIFLVLPYYLVWHYSTALFDIRNIWKNFLIFIYNFFSVPRLISTLFSPWMRLNDKYTPDTLLETLVFNSMMRVFGVFVRVSFIIIGGVTLLATLVFGVIFYVIWLLLPLLLLGVFMWSLLKLTT